MPSHPFKRPRDWKNSRFLRYRSKDRNDKTPNPDSSSTSESALSESFGTTSISRESSSSVHSQASISRESSSSAHSRTMLQPRTQPQRYYQGEPQPEPQEPEELEELPFDSHKDYILGSPFGSFNLPFEPEYRAGILIVVTSPEGKLSMGLCDDDKRNSRSTSRYYHRKY